MCIRQTKYVYFTREPLREHREPRREALREHNSHNREALREHNSHNREPSMNGRGERILNREQAKPALLKKEVRNQLKIGYI